MADIKPCPFCGSTDLKHYVTSARGGRYRGVVVCKKCGARKEAYSDWTHSVSDAYCGDWKAADEFTREQAIGLVEREWNRRDGECDREELRNIAEKMRVRHQWLCIGDALHAKEIAHKILWAIGEDAS